MTAVDFKGGDVLKGYLRRIAEKLGDGAALKVGYLEGSTTADGTSVPMIAAIQNFGAPAASIPARPFFTNMVASKSPEWGEQLGKVLKAAHFNGELALERMGEVIKAELQQSVIDTNEPPLSPITLMLRMMRSQDQSLVVTGKTVGIAAARVAAGEVAKGVSTKPLIDSPAAQLVNAVDYTVET